MIDSRKKQLLDSIRYQAERVKNNVSTITTAEARLSMSTILSRLDEVEVLMDASQVREMTVITLQEQA